MANISYSTPSIWDWNVASPRTRELVRERDAPYVLAYFPGRLGYNWSAEHLTTKQIEMSELSELQSAYQELHVRYISLLPSYANPQVPPMLDHIRSLLKSAAARIGLLTSEEAQWRQSQRLQRAEAERAAQESLQRARAEAERARAERARVYQEAARAAAEARRAAGRALYQSRTQSLRARVAAGRPYYEKMAYALAARRPFLETLRAAPDNDGTRLVYCDWLEEQGDADAALFLRDHPLSLSLWSDEIGFPPRTGGYIRGTFIQSCGLNMLINYQPDRLYRTISNFGWVAVAETQETLEAVGLSLAPSAAATMTMITPAYIRPMLARLYPNAKKEK